MSENKGYSVKELADEFGVTKAGVLRLLSDDFREKYVTTINGKTGKQFKISEEGKTLLSKHFKKSNNTSNNTDKQSGNVDVNELINMFKEQLEQKDKQIERLQLLLSQSQQLQLSESEKIKSLENKLENKDNIVKKEETKQKQESDNEVSSVEPEKKGFWNKFFG